MASASGEKSRWLVNAAAASGDDPAGAADPRRSAAEAPETGLAAGEPSTWFTTIEDLGLYSEARYLSPLAMMMSLDYTGDTDDRLQVKWIKPLGAEPPSPFPAMPSCPMKPALTRPLCRRPQMGPQDPSHA